MSIIINGSPTKPFKLERGLRQGDTLSPFPFVLVVEVLNKLINKTVEFRLVRGIMLGAMLLAYHTYNSQMTHYYLPLQRIRC